MSEDGVRAARLATRLGGREALPVKGASLFNLEPLEVILLVECGIIRLDDRHTFFRANDAELFLEYMLTKGRIDRDEHDLLLTEYTLELMG